MKVGKVGRLSEQNYNALSNMLQVLKSSLNFSENDAKKGT